MSLLLILSLRSPTIAGTCLRARALAALRLAAPLGRSGTPGERVIVSDSESSGDQLLGLQACIHVLTATYYFTVCERVGFSMRAWAPRARLCYCSAVFWGHQPEQRFALCVSVEVGAM